MEIERREESSPIFNSLPKDLIMDILSRLPVKSLVRFKCVSKSWLTLFTDPYFVKMHLNQSRNHKKLVFACLDLFWTRLVVFSGNITDEPPSSTNIDVDFPLQFQVESVKFLGSCDGLILCSTFSFPDYELQLHLVNPSTREVNRLPDSPFHDSPFLGVTHHSYGFGYDASADDYKVVHIPYSYHNNGSTHITVIYTLKTNSWKRIQDFPYHVSCFERVIFLNGALHWLTEDMSKIVSLNLAEEKFQDFLLPDFKEKFKPYMLTVLRGCLCVSVTSFLDHIRLSSEFWVMKEYGKRESWTNLGFTIPRCPVKLLDFSNKNKILSVENKLLLVSNLDKNTHGYLKIPYHTQLHSLLFGDTETFLDIYKTQLHLLQFDDADTFLETIVSPSLEARTRTEEE